MRSIAKGQGYLLNEYSLSKDGIIITVNSEQEIFKVLGMPYQTPLERNE